MDKVVIRFACNEIGRDNALLLALMITKSIQRGGKTHLKVQFFITSSIVLVFLS